MNPRQSVTIAKMNFHWTWTVSFKAALCSSFNLYNILSFNATTNDKKAYPGIVHVIPLELRASLWAQSKSWSPVLMLQQIHNLFDTNNDNLTAVRERFLDN